MRHHVTSDFTLKWNIFYHKITKTSRLGYMGSHQQNQLNQMLTFLVKHNQLMNKTVNVKKWLK